MKFLSVQMLRSWTTFHCSSMGNRVTTTSSSSSSSSCVPPDSPQATAAQKNKIIKLIKPDGVISIYNRPIKVSELMLLLLEEYPKHMVCRSDSLYIGQKIPPLSQHDHLQLGHTYFLLPTHFFHSVLSFLTIASFASSSSLRRQPQTPAPPPAPSSPSSKILLLRSNKDDHDHQDLRNIKAAFLKKAASSSCSCPPFDMQKTPSGSLRIRVSEEFISQLIMMDHQDQDHQGNNNNKSSSSSSSSEDELLLCTTPQLQKDYRQLVVGSRSRQWKPKLEMITETPPPPPNYNPNRKVKVLLSASFGGMKKTMRMGIRKKKRNKSHQSSLLGMGTSHQNQKKTHKRQQPQSHHHLSPPPPPPPTNLKPPSRNKTRGLISCKSK